MKGFRLKWTPYGHQATGRTGYHARTRAGTLYVVPRPKSGYVVHGPDNAVIGTAKTAAAAIRLAEGGLRGNPLRRNGDVIDLASRRKPPPEPTPARESAQEKMARLAKYIDAHADAGITAAQMAHDFLVPEETAEGVLEAVVAKGLLRPLAVSGQTVYRRASKPLDAALAQRGHFAPPRYTDAELTAQRERARQVGEEARARAAGAKYPVGTVLTLKGGRRRYAVARVEPRYGNVQTYLLVALSGGEAGSVPSGVREDELKRHPDQVLRWEGVEARRLQQKFVTYSGIGETGDAARAAYARAGEMVRGSGPVHVDPGVRLLQQLRPLKRFAKVSLAPGGRKKGVAYVTVTGWTKDSQLRDKLNDAMNRIVQAGLGEHVNAIEAYLGRIIVTAEPAPPRNAEMVWRELARVSENADLRGNPSRKSGKAKKGKKKVGKTSRKAMQVQALLFPSEHWTPSRAQVWAKKYRHRSGGASVDPDGYIRIQQHSPREYQKGTLHRVQLAKNVEAIVGVPLSTSDAGAVRGYNARGPRQGALFPRLSSPASGRGADPDDVLY